jgi:hypothetical protein
VQALVLEFTALVAVVLSFVLATLVVMHFMRMQQAAAEPGPEPSDPSETLARVVAEIEQLAALRERGVLTEKEFAAGKAKLLRPTNA